MERRFFRSREEGNLCQRKGRAQGQWNIGVTGLGRSVGTTFVASTLAFYFQSMGKSVTFSQCLDPAEGVPLLYDAAAMEQRFGNRKFTDIYALIQEGAPVRMPCNVEQNICWILPTPGNCKGREVCGEAGTWGPCERARLVGTARGEICVFDFAADKNWDQFLLQMDVIVAVADPLPSRLMASGERFRTLKKMELAGSRCLWICNKTNAGISKRQVSGFLKTKSVVWLPALDPALLYADEYACRFHWENAAVRSGLMEIFTKTSRELGM